MIDFLNLILINVVVYKKKRKLNRDSSIDKLDTIDHLLSGVEAGVCMVFITNPLWLIKTRLQIQHRPLVETSTVVAETNTYKGLLGLFSIVDKL